MEKTSQNNLRMVTINSDPHRPSDWNHFDLPEGGSLVTRFAIVLYDKPQ